MMNRWEFSGYCLRALALGAALGALPASLPAVQTPIFPVLNDKGNAGDDIFVFGPAGGFSFSLDSTTVANSPPPEGLHSMKSTANQAGQFAPASWGVFFLNPGTTIPRPVDLSAYSAGELRLWAWCDNDNFDTLVQHQDGSSDGCPWAGVLGPAGLLNRWVPLVCPASFYAASAPGVPRPINDIVSPFRLDMHQTGTCFIDNVRFVTLSDQFAEIRTVAVKNFSDQQPAAQFTWSGLTLPAGWVRSDQYIELQTEINNSLGWGVQIYSDNTGPGANPKFVSGVPSGQPGSDPAGLVDAAKPGHVLPLAWSIKALGAAAPVAEEPNNNGQGGRPNLPNSFQWLYMKDLQTPNIPAQGVNPGSTAFQNGDQDPFVVVKNNVGNHFGQSPTEFGAENTPNRIFLEANFSGAVTPRTYQTTAIIVEFFYD